MDSTPLSSASSSAGSSGNLQDFTPSTSAPSSPKLPSDQLNLLPSPFYPPSYAQTQGTPQKYQTPALPAYYPPLPSTTRPSKADPKDEKTPDSGIIRDESLVRLTGAWPFNCEPALPDLWRSVSYLAILERLGVDLATRRASSHRRDYSTFAIMVLYQPSPNLRRFLGNSRSQGESLPLRRRLLRADPEIGAG